MRTDIETLGKWATIFFVNGIGDAILSLPTVRALSEVFEGRILIAFTPSKAEFLFDGIRGDKVPITAWYKPGAVPGIDAPSFDAQALARAIGRSDVFISLVNWHSEDITQLIEILRPSVTIGRGPNFQFQLRWSPTRHTIDSMFDAVNLFVPTSWRAEDFRGLPPMPLQIVQEATKVRADFPECSNTLAVHLDTKPEKNWAENNIIGMLELFLGWHPEMVAFLVGMESTFSPRGLHQARIVSCLGLPIPTSICLLSQADLFVGVNSCFLHAADLLGVPGVGLFESGAASQWGFRLGPGMCVEAQDVVGNIRPEEVAKSLEWLLKDHHKLRHGKLGMGI